jgi:branched-chain amino acid transport system ATP-binding protein
MSLLRVDGVTKRFGGLVANRDVTFDVGPGELVGVIGPNGAGKSTLFDLITGFTRPDAGRIVLDDRDITRDRPDQISRSGVARTFQKLRPFPEMTAAENVMVGAFQQTANPAVARSIALEALASVGLGDRAGAHARGLSTGQRKRLELARALAIEPRLLLLDEVLAGLNPSEIRDMLPVIRAVRDRGITIVMIEHVMQAVMSLADTVYVLAEGRIIAEGAPDAIAHDPAVVEAYLGHGAAGRVAAAGGLHG